MTIEEEDDEPATLKPVKVRIKIHDRGPALWPERFNAKKLRQIAKTLGSYHFSALYQGAPSPEGGGRFKRSWFKYSTIHDEHIRLDGRTFRLSHCRRFACVDLAFAIKKDSDYTVIGAFAVTPDYDLALLDLHRERMTGDQLVPSCRKMAEKWKLEYTGIEDVAAQTLVLQTARKNGLCVRALKANMDKGERSMPLQIFMEAGQVWFPRSHAELDNLEHELLTFPQGAKDDVVDVMAYAAREMQKFGPASIPQEERDRLEAERIKREWEEAQRRDREAQLNADDPRWWNNGWIDHDGDPDDQIPYVTRQGLSRPPSF